MPPMTSVSSTLSRALMVVARAKESAVLTVYGRGGPAERVQIACRDGRMVALRVDPYDGDAVGHALRRSGQWSGRGQSGLDATPAVRAYRPAGHLGGVDVDGADVDEAVLRGGGEQAGEQRRAGEPVGRYAIRVGAVRPEAVRRALRDQMARRLLRLFASEPSAMRLKTRASEVGVPALDEPPRIVDIVYETLFAHAQPLPPSLLEAAIGEAPLALTALGESMMAEGAGGSGARHWLRALTTAGSLVALKKRDDFDARARAMVYALAQVGACGPPRARPSCTVLLTKKRQLTSAASPDELLGVSPGATPRASRQALRGLAKCVHPDRCGPHESATIRHTAHEVMKGLLHAQRAFAHRRGVRSGRRAG